RAAVAPANPPPTTTTRGVACAKTGAASKPPAVVAAADARNARRLTGLGIRPPDRYLCSAYHAAMASTSASLKPLAIRSITVDGRCPVLKARICATMSATSRPARRGTALSTSAAAAWQPEQDDAPGGGSGAAENAAPAHPTDAATAARRCAAFMAWHL